MRLPRLHGELGPGHANPYFAKTDEQGRFTMTDVPPGTYTLVVWHPYIRTAIEQTVTIGPKGTVQANIVVGHNWAALRQRGDRSSVHPIQRTRGNEARNRSDDPQAGSLNRE